ncbi:MAG: hypothetical protein JNK85_25825 [Verrucomicrobiales bacterium]|nr:hypothetical protein [Verrucomicrobiales bacterium]
MPDSVSWEVEFRAIYERSVQAFEKGHARTPAQCVDATDRKFLATIGCSAQELFDFVEDGCLAGEPSFDDVLAVTRLRRDYFLNVQGGVPPARTQSASSFPSRSAVLDGISWLPRLIAKAEAKLRGELPPELMFGCGGDRPFLRSYGVSLAEFLATVRDAKGDTRPVLELLRSGKRGR